MEIIHQPSWATVHCEVCNQRNCQLSSRGKEWSLGLEGFPGGSAATNLPAAQETRVSSGQEPAMAAHLPVRCLHMWAQLPVTPPPTPSSGLELRRDQALPTAPSQGGVCTCVRAKWLQARVTLLPCGRQPAGLLCPWDFPGKITGVGHHFLLWGTF